MGMGVGRSLLDSVRLRASCNCRFEAWGEWSLAKEFELVVSDEVEGGGDHEEVDGDALDGSGSVSSEEHLAEGEAEVGEGVGGEGVFGSDAEQEEDSEREFDVDEAVGVGADEEAGEEGLFEGGLYPRNDAVVIVAEG